MTAATHKLIAKHAVMFARECYEEAASLPNGIGNAFYREWPNMDDFCRANWPMFVPDVRNVFVDMLALPDEVLPACEKEKIHEALCYDGAAKAQPQILVPETEHSLKSRLAASTVMH
jgi:hypothetical protein